MIKPSAIRLARILLAAATASLAGCAADPRQGYSFESSYAQNVQSISVPVFRNSTFSRGIDVELTEAVIAELRKSTPYAIVQSDSPQTTLRGTITNSELRKLSTGRTTGLVEELAVVMTVDFEWKDNRNGKVMVARRGFTASGAFAPAQGVNERLETGQHGAIQELARAIVNEMRSGW